MPLRLGLWRQELVSLLSECPQLLGNLGRLRQLRGREHTAERLCQRDARLQQVCLETCQMLLVRLDRSRIQAARIQEHILKVLPGGPHLRPERPCRVAVRVECRPDLLLLALTQI
jgi:hypothetical protein